MFSSRIKSHPIIPSIEKINQDLIELTERLKKERKDRALRYLTVSYVERVESFQAFQDTTASKQGWGWAVVGRVHVYVDDELLRKTREIGLNPSKFRILLEKDD